MMEKQLIYSSMLSLEQIALRRIAVILFNDSDIIDSITHFPLKWHIRDECQETWQETVEDKVIDKVSKLGLPESLSKQIIDIVQPIGLQIRRWKRFHEAYLSDSHEDLDEPVLKLLSWTSAGTVDYRKTAEVLVCCDVVDIVKRYKLACLYCLENYIPVFWKKLTEPTRKYFHDEENFSLMEEPHLQFCWPYILYEEQSKLDNMPGRLSIGNGTTFHQYVFEYSAFKGNKTAAEYFFQKLTPAERNISLIRTVEGVLANRNNNLYKYNDDFPKEKLSDVLCYLLSLMTPQQQMKIFKEQSCEILPCFFDWPWQDYFLQITEWIWTFLPQSDYSALLLNIYKMIKNSGHYFPRLFQEFFHNSPSEFRDVFVTAEYIFGNFFTEFLKVQDSETIKVVFRNLDMDNRMRLVSSLWIFHLFVDLIMKNKWHLIELFLQEATLSKENREGLKKAFMKFLTEKKKFYVNPKERKRFFHFIDRSSSNKRSSEVETLTKSKKLCREE